MSDALSHAKRIVDSPWAFVSSAASPHSTGYAGTLYHAHQVAQALIDKEEEVKRLRADLKASEFWNSVFPDGMDEDQVKNELLDYHFLMEQVPIVYCHVTGGRLSKTTYYAKTVTDEADNAQNDAVQREIDDLIESGELVREEEVRKLREALEGVIRVADRKTDEFDRARAALGGSE